MGLLKKLKKGVEAAADTVGARAADVAKRVVAAPADTAAYAGRLKTNVEADLNNPNSAGSKFAHAPAGQYYLPGPAKAALGFLLPTPAETVNSNKQFVQHPGVRSGLRAGLADVSIATAPAAVVGVAALPKAAAKGASEIAERGLGRTLASESGQRVFTGIAKKGAAGAAEDAASAGAKVQAAKAVSPTVMKSERVAGKISGERVASVGLADEAADLTKAARLQNVPDELLSQMRTPGAKLERVRRLESRPGASGGLSRAPTAPEAIKSAGIEPARAPRSRIAGATSEANRAGQGGLKAASAVPAAPPAAVEVAEHGAASVFQKMPDVALKRMAEQGVSGAQLESARRSAAALKSKPAFGATAPKPMPINAAQAEALNVANPKAPVTVSTGRPGMLPKATREAAAAEVKAEAPVAKAAKPKPRGSNPDYSNKPGKVTTRAISNEDLAKLPGGANAPKATVAEKAPVAKKAPGGSIKGQPRGAAVKRAPSAGFEEALSAAGEKPSGEVAARTVEAKVSNPKVARQAETTSSKRTPTKNASPGEAAGTTAPHAEVAPPPASEGTGKMTLDQEFAAPKARSIASRAAGVGRRSLKIAKVAAEVSLPLAAGGALLANRSSGAGDTGAANATPTSGAAQPNASNEPAAPGPDEIGLRAVAEVAKKKGKRGTQALIAGLNNTKAAKGLIGSQYDSYLREAVRRAFEANQ